ncbi:UMTA methyltransferase [Paraphaeosphaeria minitans]|uniref:UMTA methyltransferase n=1 Tax=Paraphaeosphaeria minitans TaxID=565426 RepID=A0A9P6GHU2_9PLEO|nr:UMTA methyltransferase [Paraphaeosphaeria minitans]
MTINNLIGWQSAPWLRVGEGGVLHAAKILFLGGEHDLAGSTHVSILPGLFPPISLGVAYRGKGQLIAARRRRQLSQTRNSLDEREEIRLEVQYDIIYRFFEERHFFPSIPNPRSILECGYGRGQWAVQVAEDYEQCEVSRQEEEHHPFHLPAPIEKLLADPVKLRSVYPEPLPDQPDNLSLYGYNLNDRFDVPDVFEYKPYDLIHSRFVAQGIKSTRWPTYVQDMKRLLKPTGWVQMAEYYLNIQSNSGRLGIDSALRKWWGKYVEAMESSRRDPRVGPQRLGRLLSDAGYKHINLNTFQLPIGGWRSEPHMAKIGRDSVEMVSELLESASLWLFTDRLGMSAAEVGTLNSDAKRELRDTTLQLYLPIYVAWARRS